MKKERKSQVNLSSQDLKSVFSLSLRTSNVAILKISRPEKKVPESLSSRKTYANTTATAGLKRNISEAPSAVNLFMVSKKVTYPNPVTIKPR